MWSRGEQLEQRLALCGKGRLRFAMWYFRAKDAARNQRHHVVVMGSSSTKLMQHYFFMSRTWMGHWCGRRARGLMRWTEYDVVNHVIMARPGKEKECIMSSQSPRRVLAKWMFCFNKRLLCFVKQSTAVGFFATQCLQLSHATRAMFLEFNSDLLYK